MTTHEQIPPFLAEMPEPARASYLSPGIAPKPLPCELTRVMPWHDELLPADLREYVRDVAERTQWSAPKWDIGRFMFGGITPIQ